MKKHSDKLDRIFSLQKELQIKGYGNHLDKYNLEERESYTKDSIFCGIKEFTEVLDAINWKVHKKTRFNPKPKVIREEIVDCFKFLLNIALAWGITSDDLYEAFNLVTKRNWDRIKNNY